MTPARMNPTTQATSAMLIAVPAAPVNMVRTQPGTRSHDGLTPGSVPADRAVSRDATLFIFSSSGDVQPRTQGSAGVAGGERGRRARSAWSQRGAAHGHPRLGIHRGSVWSGPDLEVQVGAGRVSGRAEP